MEDHYRSCRLLANTSTTPGESILKKLYCEEFDAFESTIDTKYFGVASAKTLLKKPILTAQRQDELLDFLRGFEFVTILNRADNPTNNRWLGQRTSAFLTDMNVQLEKTASHTKPKASDSTIISDELAENDRIIQIAETAFRFSRFLNDPYLSPEKAKRIYGDITKNAFGKVGRFFVTAQAWEKVAGFLLFSINERGSSATIELIATDHNLKRRGLGSLLIQSMEAFISKRGVATLKVGTQLGNLEALKFYLSYGFRISECNSIYHYWPFKA